MKFHTSIAAIAVLLLIASAHCKKKQEGTEAPAASSAALDGDLAKGKELYANNACNSCHGDLGHGDGPAGAALNPKPRNFADTAAYKQGSTEDAIVATLEKGVPGTTMVSYAHIPEADRRLIAKYVVHLQK